MNRITRRLAIAGLGLGTALVMGAAPAQAAGTTTTTTAATTSGASSSHSVNDWNDDDVVGYFRTLRGCDLVGRIGEARGRWDDYDCSRVGFGSYRRAWELSVSTDDWNGGWDNDNWYRGCYPNWHGGDWNNNWHSGGWGDNWHGGGWGNNRHGGGWGNHRHGGGWGDN
jgi:hypothetical protein